MDKTVASKKYSANITRDNPAAFVFMIDQSGSMNEFISLGKSLEISKAKAVSNLINDFIEELILTCQRDNQLKDYFEVIVIGYGKKDDDIEVVWEGALAKREFVNISDLKSNILEQHEETIVETMPWGSKIEIKKHRNIWVRPYAHGLTPMYSAFSLGKKHIENWISRNRYSFPPIVFNITDGEATDVSDMSELSKVANDIKDLSTNDGNVLLFNCLLSNKDEKEIVFPSLKGDEMLVDNSFYNSLFECSSVLPKELSHISANILKRKDILDNEVKCLVLNSSITTLVKLLNIGTKATINNTR